MEKSLKTVVVGDGAVGKTCMLISYAKDSFPEDYIPTIFDNYNATEIYRNKNGEEGVVQIGLWDTAGQEDYDRLRPLSYPETSAFIICFSLVDPVSLENVKSKWYPELRQFSDESTPILLVGTKSDLRENSEVLRQLRKLNKSPVTTSEGEKVAKEIGATYYECSARTKKGLKRIFQGVISLVEEPKKREKKRKGGLFGSLAMCFGLKS